MNSPLEDILEKGAHIWLRERDRNPVPCTIHRQVFHEMIIDYAQPYLAARIIPPATQPHTPPIPHHEQ